MTSLQDVILAVVVKTAKAKKVAGGAPIFIVESDEELEEISSLLSRITMSMVHQISDGVRIIVKH